MSRRGVLAEVVTALILTAAGGALFALLATLGLGYPLRHTVALILTAYALVMLARAGRRTGRITLGLMSVLLAAGLALLDAPLSYVVVMQCAWLWLLRCTLFHRSLTAIVADGALTVVALAGAAAAFLHTASPTVGLWCLLLIQAFHVFIPPRWIRRDDLRPTPETGFDHAHRQAEVALRQLFNS